MDPCTGISLGLIAYFALCAVLEFLRDLWGMNRQTDQPPEDFGTCPVGQADRPARPVDRDRLR